MPTCSSASSPPRQKMTEQARATDEIAGQTSLLFRRFERRRINDVPRLPGAEALTIKFASLAVRGTLQLVRVRYARHSPIVN